MAVRLRRVISANTTGFCPTTPGSSRKLFSCAVQQVKRQLGGRAETAALDQDRPLVKDFRWLYDVSVRGEHRGIGQAKLDQLEAHEPVVHAREGRARELDHVDLNLLA